MRQVSFTVRQGPREHQEDFHLIKRIKGMDFSGWLLAVADGHGGAEVAEFCIRESETMFCIAKAQETEEALRALVKNLVIRTVHFHAGSTLSIALIAENHQKVSVAILGDSPVIVLDRTGQLHISPEHNVRSNITERRAAEKRGGVYRDGYLFAQNGMHGLQLSRALGNADLASILLREPDIYTIPNPQWILVASDGIFDPAHHDTPRLLEEIRTYAAESRSAEDIMQWAEQRGLNDNATALVWNSSRMQKWISQLLNLSDFLRKIITNFHATERRKPDAIA